ncbi:methyltransferase domain-containing protein [Flavobacterium sp. 20NA77.7]|uniref:Methyltransferase domain-containing protein n=1 Tax=Flavobacterium nakdongensis TaxID=3073563 RepID=A0ABY9RBE6_9FLAO|nr:methyltransferase domain-containing protein [Flavobacterium sp. 20NA77.7]WMW78563.1 methyltransferase domain-containing protein [Flavobacterium sp. 20NA77.7]
MTLLNKSYWENRYTENETGWDIGVVSTPLQTYIDQLTNKNISILIPGAGNGYEFDYLLNKGFKDTYVMDIAQKPLDTILERNEIEKRHLIHQDFFEHNGQYDLIIEQTFFCALDPTLRRNYVTKMLELLKPNGKIIGLLFNFELTLEGPPFGGSKEEYIDLFNDYFTIKILENCYNSIKPRSNRELFFIFEKK